MMKGKTYIDGKDIFTAFGALVTDGGYSGLVEFPSLKTVEYNDWQEEDGIEPDLSSPVLDTKDVSIPFAFVGTRIDPFVAALSDKGYHSFEFRELGRTFRLRLVSVGTPSVCGDLRLVTMTFADDFPLDGYEYAEPTCSGPETGCTIDGRDLSEYGIRILQGTRAQLEAVPAVKPALSRNIRTVSGAYYDGDAAVRFKSRNLSLYCLVRSRTAQDFWKNHYALLYDLTRPQDRILKVLGSDTVSRCYYGSMNVQEFMVANGIWMKFNLTLIKI